MKILFVINIDMSKNGPSVHLLNDIMTACKKRGHSLIRIERRYNNDTWVVSTNHKIDEEIYTVETVEPRKLSYAKRYLDDLKYITKCKKIMEGKKVDAVFLQSCNDAGFRMHWISKNLKCPAFYNVQDIFPLDMVYEGTMGKLNPMYWAFDVIQKYAYKKSTSVITISEDMKDTLVGLGVPSEKVQVVHNWAYAADYNKEYDDYIKNQFFSDQDKFHVVYAGNIGAAQGVENLVYAAEVLMPYKDILVTIIGAGSRLKKCKSIAKEKKLSNIRFLDLLPQHLAQYVYNNADVNIVTLAPGIIHTSLPSKTAACYRSNRPVIYCVEEQSTTIQKLLKGNNLIRQCNPGDSVALANKILELTKAKMDDARIIPFEQVLSPQQAESYVEIIEGKNK